MADLKLSFFLVLSTIGALLLFFLAICAFINLEALKLKKQHHSSSGFALLVASMFYAGVSAYCYNEINKQSDNQHQYYFFNHNIV